MNRPLRWTTADTIGLSIAVVLSLACVSGSSNDDPTLDAGASECFDEYSMDGFGRAAAAGTLSTSLHAIQYDEGRATAAMRHKRDVDPIEDGCVGHVELSLSSNGACDLRLTFEAMANEPQLVLTSASLNIDSNCPGWRDAEEGYFELSLLGTNTATLDPVLQVDDNRRSDCVSRSFTMNGVAELVEGDRPVLTIDLSDLTVTGAAHSYGEEDLSCPGL